MTLRNRVLPDGRIVADPARGTFTGNRGILVAPDGRMMTRQWAGKAWITCLLAFRGRTRPIAQPHTWTELFFLDEAVAFSAGHRPCAYCRREAYNAFKARFPGAPKAVEMDALLHSERLQGREKRLHPVEFDSLPDGAFIHHEGMPHLIRGRAILPYTPKGYLPAKPRPSGDGVALTPPSLLAVLEGGYIPAVHLTAAASP